MRKAEQDTCGLTLHGCCELSHHDHLMRYPGDDSVHHPTVLEQD